MTKRSIYCFLAALTGNAATYTSQTQQTPEIKQLIFTTNTSLECTSSMLQNLFAEIKRVESDPITLETINQKTKDIAAQELALLQSSLQTLQKLNEIILELFPQAIINMYDYVPGKKLPTEKILAAHNQKIINIQAETEKRMQLLQDRIAKD